MCSGLRPCAHTPLPPAGHDSRFVLETVFFVCSRVRVSAMQESNRDSLQDILDVSIVFVDTALDGST